ncbi:hypothetical protein CSKR_109238 [Clonorchis sinensis]|uniref:Uncharacterized protein n=1 Tax=Clonorchis sinensis TaxID=79923 RepID=A0A3R7FSI0_CLOSI|nr:hypothetical protein CSKR_109238 [Clonorchis sinensis]
MKANAEQISSSQKSLKIYVALTLNHSVAPADRVQSANPRLPAVCSAMISSDGVVYIVLGKQTSFCRRLARKLAESLVHDALKRLNVLHQSASGFSWHDIRDIAIHVHT